MKFRRLPHAIDLPLPAAATEGSAGLDLRSTVDLVLAPMERWVVPTGFGVELPAAHEGQIRPRSGLAVRHGITVLNAPGTIDEDFRGEIGVILINLGEDPFVIRRGDRIAQLVVAPVARVDVREVSEATATARGEKGFGASGVA